MEVQPLPPVARGGLCSGAVIRDGVQRPLAYLAFVLTIAYVPFISGAATALRWIVLSIGVPVLMFCVRGVNVTTAGYFVYAFMAWMAVCSLGSEGNYDAVAALWQMALMAGIFTLGSFVEDLGPMFRAMGFGLIASLIAAPFTGTQGLVGYAGLFAPNPTVMGEIAALVFVGCLAWRKCWMAAWLAPILLLSKSRAAIAAIVVAGVVALWRNYPRWAFWLTCSACLIISPLTWIATSGILRKPNGAIAERLAIWSDTLAGITPFGNGLGSFYGMFPYYAELTDTLMSRPEHAHSDLMEIAFEGGYLGAILAILAGSILLLRTPWSPAKFVLIALCVEAAVGFPLHQPATAFLGLLVAGFVCARRDLVVVPAEFSGTVFESECGP